MITVPRTEMSVRTWLRADPALVALVGGDARKIDVDFSGDTKSTHMVLRRIGGAMSTTVPLDTALMSFDCWGRGRGAALALITGLTEKLVNAREVPLDDDTQLRGWSIIANVWLPDDTQQPRYILTAQCVVSARARV